MSLWGPGDILSTADQRASTPRRAKAGAGVVGVTWGFPKIRGTFFGGPYNTDYSISGSIWGSPYFGKLAHGGAEDDLLMGVPGMILLGGS